MRQFWSLCDIVDPVRLRMEVLNPLRNRQLYVGDPLAPSAWPIDCVFATVMLGSPLGWFEVSGLAPETVACLKPFVATWKRHCDRLHAGVAHPVGAKLDGVAWTGFVVTQEAGASDVLLFRELNAEATFALDLAPYCGKGVPTAVEVLSPRGAARLEGATLVVTVADKLDFAWVRLPPRR